MWILRITGVALAMALFASPALGAGRYAPGFPIGVGDNATGAIPGSGQQFRLRHRYAALSNPEAVPSMVRP